MNPIPTLRVNSICRAQLTLPYVTAGAMVFANAARAREVQARPGFDGFVTVPFTFAPHSTAAATMGYCRTLLSILAGARTTAETQRCSTLVPQVGAGA
jgi:hypothetical protein